MNNRIPSIHHYRSPSLRLSISVAVVSLHMTAISLNAAEIDPPVTEEITANTDIAVVSPSNTFFGTRGLTQTASAEALGEGRLIFNLQGAWYQQQLDFAGGPNKDAHIFTGIGSLSFGISRHVDAFVSLAGYGSSDYESDKASGLGSVGGGLQATLPFAPAVPIRMGAQVGIYQGLSDNPIDSNESDGFNYFETRTGLDFMAKLIQTVVVGSENLAIKLHFNEGLVTSGEASTEPLLLLAAGIQFNLFNAVFGAEANARTSINEIDWATDPLWVTPSIQFRTAYDINVTLGGDIALSQDRPETSARALEPYRLFSALTFTFDTQAGVRKVARDKARREAQEKGKLRLEKWELSNDLTRQTREDSIARSKQAFRSDSLAEVMADKAYNDSSQMANKAAQDSTQMAGRASQDSLALLDSQRRLAEEKSKRSEAEKQLLSTGMLLMDAVYFESNKTDISINSKPYLNIIAKMLTKYPKLRIEVSGHTDALGSDDHNLTLSQGRAQSVGAYMESVAPELRGMLTAKGYGESQPKSDNGTAAGRKMNRRTELQVLNKEILKEYNP